eukprot:scaffold2858_cov659-Pavlova_lutheri.AAC.146
MEREQRGMEEETASVEEKIEATERMIEEAKKGEAKREAEWWEMQAKNATAERTLKRTIEERMEWEKRIKDIETRMEQQWKEMSRIERRRNRTVEATQREQHVLREFNQTIEPVKQAVKSETEEAKLQADEIEKKQNDPEEWNKVKQLNQRLGNLLCQHEQLDHESHALDKRHEQLQQQVDTTKEKIRAQADAHQVILQHLNAEEQAARQKLLKVLEDEQRAQEELSFLVSACDALEARYKEISHPSEGRPMDDTETFQRT